MFRQVKLASAAGVLFMSVCGQAHAALVSCPDSFTTDGTAKVTHSGNMNTAASACQYIDPPDNSNVASISNINTASFFGFGDWMSNNQLQIDTPDQLSGTWSITNVDFASRDYIIVFKDGADTNLVAFSLNEEVSFGDWYTPFVNPPFSVGTNGQANSHYTIAYRNNPANGNGNGGGGGNGNGNGNNVPEPGSLALLGMGLLGVVAFRRRQRG